VTNPPKHMLFNSLGTFRIIWSEPLLNMHSDYIIRNNPKFRRWPGQQVIEKSYDFGVKMWCITHLFYVLHILIDPRYIVCDPLPINTLPFFHFFHSKSHLYLPSSLFFLSFLCWPFIWRLTKTLCHLLRLIWMVKGGLFLPISLDLELFREVFTHSCSVLHCKFSFRCQTYCTN